MRFTMSPRIEKVATALIFSAECAVTGKANVIRMTVRVSLIDFPKFISFPLMYLLVTAVRRWL